MIHHKLTNPSTIWPKRWQTSLSQANLRAYHNLASTNGSSNSAARRSGGSHLSPNGHPAAQIWRAIAAYSGQGAPNPRARLSAGGPGGTHSQTAAVERDNAPDPAVSRGRCHADSHQARRRPPAPQPVSGAASQPRIGLSAASQPGLVGRRRGNWVIIVCRQNSASCQKDTKDAVALFPTPVVALLCPILVYLHFSSVVLSVYVGSF